MKIKPNQTFQMKIQRVKIFFILTAFIACFSFMEGCGKEQSTATPPSSASVQTTNQQKAPETAATSPLPTQPASDSTANKTPTYRPIDTEKDGFEVTCQSTHSAVDAYGTIVSANVIDFTAIARNIDSRVNGTKIILLASGKIVDGNLDAKDYGTFQIQSGGSVVLMTDESIAKIRKALQDASASSPATPPATSHP